MGTLFFHMIVPPQSGHLLSSQRETWDQALSQRRGNPFQSFCAMSFPCKTGYYLQGSLLPALPLVDTDPSSQLVAAMAQRSQAVEIVVQIKIIKRFRADPEV